jgi:hypothetical protein
VADPPVTTVDIAHPLAGSMRTIDTVTTATEAVEVAVEKIALNVPVADMTTIAEAGVTTNTAVVHLVENTMTDAGAIVEVVAAVDEVEAVEAAEAAVVEAEAAVVEAEAAVVVAEGFAKG